MKTHRRGIAIAFGVGAMVLIASATAWACTSSAALNPISPASAAPGATVTVSGRQFTEAERGVEVRLTSSGSSTGTLLAVATGPSFSVNVQVPSVSAGRYTVVAYGRESDGSMAGQAATSFEVTAGAPAQPQGTAWSQQTQPDAQVPAPGTSSPGSAAPPPAEQPQPTGSTTSAQPQPAGATTSAQPVDTTAAQPAGATTSAQPVGTTAGQPAGATAAQSPATATARSKAGVAPAPARATTPVGSSGKATTETSAAPVVGEDQAADLLPTDAETDQRRGSASASRRPWGTLDEQASSSSVRAPQLAIGVGMLAVGLVALFAGFGVLEGRRRRGVAPSSAGHRP